MSQTWKEKLNIVKADSKSRADLAVVFDSPEGLPQGEIEKILELSASLPDDYLEFLKSSNGLFIDCFVLFGAGSEAIRDIFEHHTLWAEVIDTQNDFPIGEDSCAQAFVLSQGGQISLVNPSGETTQKFCNTSFGEFLSDYLMGPQYQSLFPVTPTTGEWVDYLREKNWLD